MGFKLLVFPPRGGENANENQWSDLLNDAIPGMDVRYAESVGDALEMIDDVDAAYGDITPELFERAKNLKWIACPQAGPRAGYYHQALIDSDVVVTNTREIYNDHISAHIMSYVLAFARGLHVFIRRQLDHNWNPNYATVHLPDATALIFGVGGIGAETARLCAEFGMEVLAVDPRVEQAPKGVAELHRPGSEADLLARADFVIATVPETPATQGMFNADTFGNMRSKAVFINIGRGATTVLDDLVAALRSGEIGGAALDVFQIEPLPADNPLWGMDNVIITPHMAGHGPYLEGRRTELFIENCKLFNEGRPLKNVVDKHNWF